MSILQMKFLLFFPLDQALQSQKLAHLCRNSNMTADLSECPLQHAIFLNQSNKTPPSFWYNCILLHTLLLLFQHKYQKSIPDSCNCCFFLIYKKSHRYSAAPISIQYILHVQKEIL